MQFQHVTERMPHEPHARTSWRRSTTCATRAPGSRSTSTRARRCPTTVKAAWLADSSSASRQYLLPFLRPLARAAIVLFQVVKVFVPRKWAHSRLLHRLLAWGLKRFVSPEANWLILRHFHLGSQVLAFIGANSPVPVATSPLEPADIDALKDDMFLQHDLNLFNFVIRLNQALRDAGPRAVQGARRSISR